MIIYDNERITYCNKNTDGTQNQISVSHVLASRLPHNNVIIRDEHTNMSAQNHKLLQNTRAKMATIHVTSVRAC